jgi:VWFA-related protein
VLRPTTSIGALTQLASVLSLSGALILASARPAPAQEAAQQKPSTFRVAVDVVAIDVQVIGRNGRPVSGLGAADFDVRINGQKRRVVSAEYVDSYASGPGSAATSEPASGPGSAPPPRAAPPRTIMLAVDCITFDFGVARTVMDAARSFVRRLPAGDRVGLFVYPTGAKLEPTTDRDELLRGLNTVTCQKDPAIVSQFNLRPSEIVDLLAAGAANNLTRIENILIRLCGQPPDPSCVDRLFSELRSIAVFYEGQAHASLGMLRSVVKQMGMLPGRKTLVLLSGGMLASDRPGGRPDISEMGIQIGKEAARANTAIYALFLDSTFLGQFTAETRLANPSMVDIGRDSAILGRWLDQFSGAAGGAMFNVQSGRGEAAFDRILTETSSYYVLGVEPAETDRDGRAYEISIKTNQKNVEVRGRKWVSVPKASDASTDKGTAGLTAPAAPSPEPPPPPPRFVHESVQNVADLFDRSDHLSVERSLKQSPDLANLIRHFRASDTPWPDAPRRAAVLALEIAGVALRSNNGYARDEGARLLAQYSTLVRQPTGPDAFECAWLRAEVAMLEGLFMPESAMFFVPQALQRCPNDPRLHLARAILTEQQWVRGLPSALTEADVIARYESAMGFPEARVEASVRAAWFFHRTGRSERALALLDAAPQQPDEPALRYLAALVRGQVLRGVGRLDEAVAAVRSALAAWPGAQSARVALMTLLVARGERAEAAALAEAAETAAEDQHDPWWLYWLGDYPAYPVIMDALRKLTR